MTHEHYMKIALELAIQGLGRVRPNPMVGAVIVNENKIIGKGYHEKFGEPHAEINALRSCVDEVKGATLYVTLEPCCHYGKTPPCTEAIIRSGIKRVVIGTRDPNPLVSGKGIEILKTQGIEVVEAILQEECMMVNRFFFHHMKMKMPYVAMKYAMTADGKIATKTGESKWISGEGSRRYVQQLRRQYQGIMVGIGTVIKDNPLLTYKADLNQSPIRIICDSQLRMPLTSQIAETAKHIKTYVVFSKELSETRTGLSKRKALERKGFCLLDVPAKAGHLDLSLAFRALGALGIQSVLVEGGSTLNEAVIRKGLAQYLYTFIGSKILGGHEALTPIGGNGVESMSDARALDLVKIKKIEEDVLLEYRFRKETGQCLLAL
ncbi:bifunctional diaminohydroxyphosphoribosylaminopyrimidine deaminase/5-amino-6-(5-phosphoribosylamino)uracil reductase RibD [Fusibacter ferrireducens]|uniref:Riboflavin biosynthesis protein RibD n=1 Tax=Fusibacter ferrireducens TaxID=2785058 RepID=A0ABR9ZWY3_9FIRM|nr:bifunctional diaminohydroxyphosphoribosylaminopyrimidine deaminase/5-amino-6-(5-phosphoribosylamino)uracil reductase RibD [Fusibacter ferrireducens]MBF4694964.1 bifunctional diaminohydroxyphosphoribosylaminopyrimidine deaminase/5-amino-6-(5-phosphoribosylamino)uracil reductase RibD [Fusibacter ferrireducens]